MHRSRSLFVFLTVALAGSIGAPGSAAGSGGHCAYLIQPGVRQGRVASARLVSLGCFRTIADAVAAGTEGATILPANVPVAELTQALVARSRIRPRGSILIGTEFDGISYGGGSNSYFASNTCSDTRTWEVASLGSVWNNRFASGKGFGGCDRNRKFAGASFAGESTLCTPNCPDYGGLRNDISSLRWRA